MKYLLIITEHGREVFRKDYEFRAQADAHGAEWERKVPAARADVREIGTGMLARLALDDSQRSS
jgi:hypothetical protein